MIYRQNRLPRKGMILLVVVAFLALFSVMGITYIIYADSQLRQTGDDVNAQDVRQNPIKMVDLDPSFILNFFLERFLYDQADVTLDASGAITNLTPDSVYSALRGHSLARNIYGGYDGAGSIAQLNDRPFNGTGKLNKQVTLNGQNLEEWKIVNMAFPVTGKDQSTPPKIKTFMLSPERVKFDENDPNDPNDGFFVDNGYPYSKTSSWNAPYTYPDHNNFYLGWLKSDGSKVIPSFHREYIFGKTDLTSLPTTSNLQSENPNWINQVGKYLSMRPRPFDYLSTADSASVAGNQNATINLINQRISESKLFPYPEADGMDVKNLEGYPGGNDSIWIDVGSPIFKTLDGRKYKIMIAPLILDLDGKINVNVAGNVMGSLKDPLNPHASNQGWGPWEVNPAKIAQSAEIQTLINSYTNPNTGGIQLPGRYTNSLRIPTGADGSTVNYPSSASYSMVDYNGTLDNGAVGNEGYFKTPAFNDVNAVSPFQSFPYFPPKNYGAAGNAEIKTGAGNYNHASLYNPLRPAFNNRVFSSRETASLLNWGNKSGRFSSSYLMQFFPNSMEPQNPNTTNPQTIKNRSFVTTLSSDFGRITTPPYIANSVASPYQMNGNYPKGNDIAYAISGTPVTTGSTSDTETFTNGMGITTTSSLRSINSKNMKVDLSRTLTAYPTVSTTFTSAVGGGGGRYVNNTGYTTAVSDRQKFAFDLFTALLKSTGAKDMSLSTIPLQGVGATDSDYEANRYLAQLAANMVDYIDNDDVMTKFVWKYDPALSVNAVGGIKYYPCKHEPTYWEDTDGNILMAGGAPVPRDASLDERVYGVELNKVVLNEVYAEIINDPTDTFPEKPANSNKFPATSSKPFQVNFWVELVNPLPAATAVGSLVNHAILEQDPRAAAGDSSVYQLEIRDQSAAVDIFKFDNPLGATRPDPAGINRSKGVVSNFQPAGGGAGLNLLAPASANYLGTENAANGFIVLGSNTTFPNAGPVYDAADPTKNEIPKPFTSINNIANIKKDELKYTIAIEKPAGTPDPAYDKASFSNSLQNNNKPSLVLRRLANPYMPPQTDAAQADYNPYVTVDVMNDVKVNDAVTNATDDKKAAPPTVENRSSVVRRQPYQETAKRNVGGLFDVSTNMAKSLVKQPQHTFLRQNGTFSEVPNAGINAADNLLNLPFTWLVHLDRVPISMPELMHVSGVAPKGVTTAFNNPAFTDGVNPIGHKAPWLDGGSRLARFLEFAQVKNRQAGVAQDGRIPGLVNINAIWDVEVFRALADAKVPYDPTNSNNFIESEIDPIFNTMVADRSPSAFPAQNDKPFWSLGVGQAGGGDDWTSTARGLNNTILRNNGTLFDLPAANTIGQNREAYQKKELLTKIFNSITTKSNTFGVWLTAGFFEVTDDTVRPAKLGAEIGKADGTNIRHRMFAIVDRTNMLNAKKTNLAVAFDSNANGLMQDTAGNPLPPINLGKPVLINPANGANINLVNGMTVTIDANTDWEETVSVVLDGNGDFLFTPQKLHNWGYVYPMNNPNLPPISIKNTIKTIVNRGNPGPWVGYDRTKDRDVVPYAEIIE